jgi:hypothetical protein
MAFEPKPGDPKAWAHRILAQHAADPKSVSAIRLQFAREALKQPKKEQQCQTPN